MLTHPRSDLKHAITMPLNQDYCVSYSGLKSPFHVTKAWYFSENVFNSQKLTRLQRLKRFEN